MKNIKRREINDLKEQICKAQDENSLRLPFRKCMDGGDYVFISYSHADFRGVYCDLLEMNLAGVRFLPRQGTDRGLLLG